MNLLFIQGGSRWKKDRNGNFYTDANFTEEIWNRYRKYCEHLTVILRMEKKEYSVEEAENRFNYFDSNNSRRARRSLIVSFNFVFSDKSCLFLDTKFAVVIVFPVKLEPLNGKLSSKQKELSLEFEF